jgi:energy-coupling factor transport system ATP-binding protein
VTSLAATGPAVRCAGLGFVYPDGTRALDGIDLEIARGEQVAVVGHNGSGKSTLVRHLNGLLRATEGRVQVHGRDVGKRHVAEVAREVGVAFQDPDRQIFAGRVVDEVAFGPRNLGRRGADLERSVDGALARVGLLEARDANPYDLGRSRRKLLGIAATLALDSPIIVLDEPTIGQDAPGMAIVRALVAELAAEGRTVIAVSHDLGFVADAFPRAVVMARGRVVLDGATAEVLAPV